MFTSARRVCFFHSQSIRSLLFAHSSTSEWRWHSNPTILPMWRRNSSRISHSRVARTKLWEIIFQSMATTTGRRMNELLPHDIYGTKSKNARLFSWLQLPKKENGFFLFVLYFPSFYYNGSNSCFTCLPPSRLLHLFKVAASCVPDLVFTTRRYYIIYLLRPSYCHFPIYQDTLGFPGWKMGRNARKDLTSCSNKSNRILTTNPVICQY